MAQLLNVPVLGKDGKTTYYSGEDSGLQGYQSQMGSAPPAPPPATTPPLTGPGSLDPTLAPQTATPQTAAPAVPTSPTVNVNVNQPSQPSSVASSANTPSTNSAYTVKSGDTLGGIAKAQGTTLADILASNPQYQQNPDLIKPGQTVNLAKKYQDFFETVKGSPAVDSNPRQQIQDFTQKQEPITNPQTEFQDALASMNPVERALYDQISAINTSQSTQQTFTEEFAQLQKEQGIEGLKTDLMNINNIINGTEDDIRDEITKAGGTGTESQIAAMTAARNKTLLKQSSALSSALQVKEDYINQIMTLTQADRAEADKQVTQKLGLTTQLTDMIDKQNTAAKGNYQKIVDSIGYQGLADSFNGDTRGMNRAEQALGLAKGALSNPTFLASSSVGKNAPASVQEYEYAKQNGYNGSFSDYQNEDANRKKSIAAAGVPQYTTDENGNVIQIGNYDALTIGRYNKAVNAATSILQKNPTFKNIIGSSAYLDRIEAAIQNPGSVGDQELLDAFTQLNTGGNRVTEAQVNLITHNQSYSDFLNKIQNKFKTGGALSNDQRNEIVALSQAVYKKYQDSYLPLYNDATSRLQAQGIPKEFWNIPSPETLSRAVNDTQAGPTSSAVNYEVQNAKSNLQAGELLVSRENKDGTRHYVAITPDELWATDIKL